MVKVLVTRPQPDAATTAERLVARGHEPVVSPLFRLEPRQLDWTALVKIPPVGLLATSANAIRFLEPAAMAVLKDLPLFHTGEKIAQVGRRMGFARFRSLGEWVEKVPENFRAMEPAPGKYLYLAGEARSMELGEVLSDEQYQVETVETYGSVAAERFSDEALAALAGPCSVLLYSRRTARTFLHLARESRALGSQVEIHAMSEQIAAEVRKAFPGICIKVASRPSEEALLELLPSP